MVTLSKSDFTGQVSFEASDLLGLPCRPPRRAASPAATVRRWSPSETAKWPSIGHVPYGPGNRRTKVVGQKLDTTWDPPEMEKT